MYYKNVNFSCKICFEALLWKHFVERMQIKPIGTAGGRQAPAPLAATMGTTAARPLSSGPRPRAVDNGWFYVNNSKNN